MEVYHVSVPMYQLLFLWKIPSHPVSETALPRATASLFCLRIIISVHSAGGRVNRWCTHSQPRALFSFMQMDCHSDPCPMGKGSLSRIYYLLFFESLTSVRRAGFQTYPPKNVIFAYHFFFSLLVSSIKPKKKTAHSENSFTLIDNTCSLP